MLHPSQSRPLMTQSGRHPKLKAAPKDRSETMYWSACLDGRVGVTTHVLIFCTPFPRGRWRIISSLVMFRSK